MWRYVSGSLGFQNLKSLNLKLTRGSLSNIVYRESYIGIRFGLGDSLPDKAYCGVQTHRVQYTFHGICRVEDINEHPFRVERMLLQLLHSGVLAAQKAVIFGSFTGSAPNDYDAGYDLPQVFDYLRQQLSLPLISGLEFGHEQRTVTLPLGARARLVNQAAATTLTIGGHPVLTE